MTPGPRPLAAGQPQFVANQSNVLSRKVISGELAGAWKQK